MTGLQIRWRIPEKRKWCWRRRSHNGSTENEGWRNNGKDGKVYKGNVEGGIASQLQDKFGIW